MLFHAATLENVENMVLKSQGGGWSSSLEVLRLFCNSLGFRGVSEKVGAWRNTPEASQAGFALCILGSIQSKV